MPQEHARSRVEGKNGRPLPERSFCVRVRPAHKDSSRESAARCNDVNEAFRYHRGPGSVSVSRDCDRTYPALFVRLNQCPGTVSAHRSRGAALRP